jgi:diketogulonate reductase-like aldo/keto reductase
LKDLDSHYVDLLLMHYPCTFERGFERFPKDENNKMRMGKTTYVDTWKALEKVLATGKVKAIGVSNFSKGEVEHLLKAGSVVWSIFLYSMQKMWHLNVNE